MGRFVSRTAVPDTSRRKAKQLWAGKRWTNCSSLEEVQIWESSFPQSCNLKHSYTSDCILTLSSIIVRVLIPWRVCDISLILKSSGNEASSPRWVEQPSSTCLPMSPMGFALILSKSQKCQIYLLLTSLTCTLLIVPYVNQTTSSNLLFFLNFPNDFHSLCFAFLCVLVEKELILASDLMEKTRLFWSMENDSHLLDAWSASEESPKLSLFCRGILGRVSSLN